MPKVCLPRPPGNHYQRRTEAFGKYVLVAVNFIFLNQNEFYALFFTTIFAMMSEKA